MPEPRPTPPASTVHHVAPTLFDLTPDLVFSIGADGTLSGLNPSAQRLLHGNSWDRLWIPSDNIGAQTALQTARSEGQAQCEATLLGGATGNGWQVMLHRLPADEGCRQQVLAICRDISARLEAARQLTDNALRARILLGAHCDIAWSTGLAGHFDADQPAWRTYTGQSTTEMMGQGWLNAVHPDDRAIASASYPHPSDMRTTEYRLRHADGGYRNVVARILPVYGSDGAVKAWVGSHTDVTATRQAEQRLRLAMQGGRMGTWDIDLGSGSMDCSSTCRASFGFAEDSLVDYQRLSAAMLEPDRQRWHALVHEAIASAGDFETELRVRWHDGSLHWTHMRGTCTRDAAGKVIGLAGISLDITTSKHNEEALRLTLAAGDVATWNWDIVADKVMVDSNMARLFPVDTSSSGPAPLARYMEVIHPDDRERVGRQIEQALQSQQPFESRYRVRAIDGQYHSVLARGRAEYGADGTPLHFPGVILDITRQSQVEDALSSSEERYSTLIELMDQAFCVIEMLYDDDGKPVDFRFLEANPAFVKQSGLENAIGKTIRSIVPDHDQYWFDIYDQVLKSGHPMHYENEAHAMERWFEVFAARLGGPGSTRLTVLFTDISERKRAEKQLRQLADDLSEMDRRKTEFLATLAHELRNPLAPIRNGLQIMRMAADQPATVERVRDVMERQVNQMVHLVNDLLDVARITRGQIELKLERTDLKTIIASAVETSMPLIEANQHHLQVNVEQQPLPLDADPTRLAQVLGNLLNNAAKYTPAQGQIVLTARGNGDEAVVEVRDSGMGIPTADLPTVFEMFTQVGQNMGRAQGGLGIGLSLVRRLAELHGGSVSAASAGAGMGSTFTVRLPLAAQAPAASENGTPHPLPTAAVPFRVLVVDDNVDAADTLAAVLGIMGHTTQVVHDGAQALAVTPEFLPQVVFLDIGLPGMNGYDVARALRQTPAGVHTVLIALTGWGAEEDRSQSSAAGFDHHLTKPANLHAIGELLATISTHHQKTAHD
ncbi:PAS domain S-box protein [Janthinobacterium sp. RB2R34]|uniref:PAS domain S-box protein n=1 Tax=Janthinobacterium sp. RB2R34 TaxID=3424193 RepID=UPI003F24F940